MVSGLCSFSDAGAGRLPRMRKWSRILAALLVVAVLGGLAWLLLRPREPEPMYEGKPLTYWLQAFSPYYDQPISGAAGPTTENANDAVRLLRTNAIPTLLRLLKTPDAPLTSWFFGLLRKQHFIPIHYTSPLGLPNEASEGFKVLGIECECSVLPELMQIYNRHPNMKSRQVIPDILADIGPRAKVAVPLLVSATSDADAYMRNNSVYALGRIGGEPSLIVPVLIRCLEDPANYTRAKAAEALAAFGTNAKPAVPALLKLLAREQTNSTVMTGAPGNLGYFSTISGPNPTVAGPLGMGPINVIGPVTAALKATDPEAASKAGVR
jgi:HEAT repeats